MRTVFFFTSPLCGACEEWKPVVEAFILANQARVIAIRCNPNLKPYTLGKWKVKYTPSAAVMEGGQLLWYVEGHLLSATELEAFVFGEKWKPTSKKTRTTPVEVDDQEDDDEEEYDDEDDLEEDEDE